MGRKITKDMDECIACGLCVELCPAVFGEGEDKPFIIKPEVQAPEEECAQRAIDSCPVSCISWA